MPHHSFQEVSFTGRAVTSDGRRRQKKFWQTINPFNLNEAGTPKGRQEILEELKAEAAQWKAEVAKTHRNCLAVET